MHKFLIVLSLVVLTGCATSPETMRTVIDAQTKARPTLAVTCPNGGCSVEYTDPRDRGLRLPTNGWDVAGKMVDVSGSLIQGAIVPLAMGNMAIHGFKALQGSGAVTTTTYDSHNVDSTHVPTIVTQPAPMTQPAPIIVPSPEPILIPTQVVNPVVIQP